MTRRLGRAALRLYPLGFRRRYGEELEALLEDSATGPRTLLDLVRGALVAHLRPPPGLALDLDDRLRAGLSGVLACWVVFAAAGLAYYKTTEDDRFSVAGHRHALLGDAHTAIQGIALIGSLAVLAGALPLVLSAVFHARRQPGRLRTLLALPALSLLLLAACTGVLAITHGRAVLGAWGLLVITSAALCVGCARAALFAMPAARARLVAALVCGTLATASMAAIALATALYAIVLGFDAPALSGSGNGPLNAPSVGVSVAVQLAAMALCAVLAATSTHRGWRALRG